MVGDIKKVMTMGAMLGLIGSIDERDRRPDGVYDLSIGINRRADEREAFMRSHSTFTTPEKSSQGFEMTPKRKKARAKSKAARKARRRHK